MDDKLGFQIQQVNVEIRGKKYKAVEPAMREMDYWFRRVKIGIGGVGMGCGWLEGVQKFPPFVVQVSRGMCLVC